MNLSKIMPDAWYQTKKGIGKCLTNSGKRLRFQIDGKDHYLLASDVQHEIAKGEEPQEVQKNNAEQADQAYREIEGASTAADMRQAALHLAKSTKGLDAMKTILAWLDHTGLGLDHVNQEAILTLLEGAWGQFAGTARDEMREALEKAKGGES